MSRRRPLEEEEERLIGNDEDLVDSHAVSTAERILQQMQLEQQQSLVTDLFALMARVMRKRVGKLNQMSDVAWDALMRTKDIHIALFSLLGLTCNVAVASIFWYSGVVLNGVRYDQAMRLRDLRADSGTVRGSTLIAIQLIMSLSTLVTCLLIGQKYVLKVRAKKRQWSNTETYDLVQAKGNPEIISKYESAYSFIRSDLRFSLALEIVVHLCHPMIWMYTDGIARTGYYVLSVLMFLRLYLVLHLIFTFSEEYVLRHEIVASSPDLQRTGYRITVGATLRMLYYKHPGFISLSLMGSTLLIFGFLIFVVERDVQPAIDTFGSLNNCMWFAVVTFTTLGYGDAVPHSIFGRTLSVLVGALGIATTTIFVGVVTNLMMQSREQRAVSGYLKASNASVRCEESAARLIQAGWRHYKRAAGDIIVPNIPVGHKSNVVYKCMKQLKSDRWDMSQAQGTARDPVIDSKMNRIAAQLRWSVRSLERHERSVAASMCSVDSLVMDIAKVIDNRSALAAGAALAFDASSE